MNDFKVTVENGRANVFTPYNQDFVKAIRNIGGSKWNANHTCWNVPIEAIPAVRNIMVNIYGCDDREIPETVSIKIKALYELSSSRGDVLFCGKTLCHSGGRDNGGKAGQDVFYISGRPFSGGSVKNWESRVEINSVINIANVSQVLYEKYLENEDKNIEIISVTSDQTNHSDLLAEKEGLLKRINEINILVGC